jgi:hypothetical protein
MGYKYLHVNTSHLPTQSTSSYNIMLEQPLQHVTHVEVIAFSTQNDFYNVHEKNSEFKFLFRGPNLDTTLVPEDSNHTIYDMTFDIAPNWYTHEGLVDAANQSMLNSLYADPGQTDISTGVILRPNLTTYLAGGFPAGSVAKKVKIRFSASEGRTVVICETIPGETNNINYGFMSHTYANRDEFSSSIYHRMGFKSNQVFFQDDVYASNGHLFNNLRPTTDVQFNSIYDLAYHTHSEDSFVDKDDFVSIHTGATVSRVHAVLNTYDKCFGLGSVSRNTKSSGMLAWETHEALHISSDIVGDFESTTPNYKNTGRSEQTNQLCRIPIDVNRASWIHYITREQEAVHSVRKSYIQSLTLTMRSTHSNVPFLTNAFNSFSITLKFTTKDDQDEPNIRQYESIERGSMRTQYERV